MPVNHKYLGALLTDCMEAIQFELRKDNFNLGYMIL